MRLFKILVSVALGALMLFFGLQPHGAIWSMVYGAVAMLNFITAFHVLSEGDK